MLTTWLISAHTVHLNAIMFNSIKQDEQRKKNILQNLTVQIMNSKERGLRLLCELEFLDYFF